MLDKATLEGNYNDIMAAYGRIDVLINGAGGNMAAATVPPDKTIFDLDIEAVRKVVELNLFGTIMPTMVFVRDMAARKQGSIINIASEAALRPLPALQATASPRPPSSTGPNTCAASWP